MPKFKVTIDRDQCISDGVCWALCPQVFEMNPDDGKSRIVEEYRTDDIGTGIVPEDLGGQLLPGPDHTRRGGGGLSPNRGSAPFLLFLLRAAQGWPFINLLRVFALSVAASTAFITEDLTPPSSM